MPSLERLVEADGGGAVEDHVDAAAQRLDVLGADGQARLHQLAADGDDLPVEVRVVLSHSVEELREKHGEAEGEEEDWLEKCDPTFASTRSGVCESHKFSA